MQEIFYQPLYSALLRALYYGIVCWMRRAPVYLSLERTLLRSTSVIYSVHSLFLFLDDDLADWQLIEEIRVGLSTRFSLLKITKYRKEAKAKEGASN